METHQAQAHAIHLKNHIYQLNHVQIHTGTYLQYLQTW